MKTLVHFLIIGAALTETTLAQEVTYRNTLSEQSVETRDLLIGLEPMNDDVRFLVTLTDKETGFVRRHEFQGQGANDPKPYLLELRRVCGINVILLTIEYPWRHDLPQYVRVLDTFAFRNSGFEFIDDTFGPLTDIALMDSTAPESKDLDMQPPILVECLPEGPKVPFRFIKNPMHR